MSNQRIPQGNEKIKHEFKEKYYNFCAVSDDGIEVEQGTGEVLVDLNARGKDRRWHVKKKKNVKMFEIITRAKDIYAKTDGGELLSVNTMYNIEHCGDILVFNNYADGSRKLHKANFCKHRLCPICNWRKTIKMFGQMSEIAEAIYKDKSVRWIFVTFTVKNCKAEELKDTLDAMNKAFEKIIKKSKQKKGTQAAKFRENLLGYVKAVEITYNSDDDTYHPHIHAEFEVRPSYFSIGYMKHAEWRSLWKEVMQLDYDPMVNVKVVQPKKGEDGEENSSLPSPGAVAEVAKYPIKVDGLLEIKDIDITAKAVITLINVCHHRRFVTFGGDIKEYARRLKLDDIENGDLTHVEAEKKNAEDGVISRTMFRWIMEKGMKAGIYVC